MCISCKTIGLIICLEIVSQVERYAKGANRIRLKVKYSILFLILSALHLKNKVRYGAVKKY
ncbi:hypothetical protein FXW30_04290 [Candidatus Liberibacter asiaticus]|nr:hypothetical protein FXW22_04240 [Candidatus Liberibacter asiaticus]KAE9511373.1 hypothetical protein FXW31_01855 [Candidatus Liberibacter asiaticus]KAE9511980.1 hypothetical protein FXW32_04240 [Candidatus Liberibacter asiaticus]KAE9513046.1 hypothetical protein FXW35_04355 [Candidatus Liberibacter asiaticus]KAE9514133.1 hypothetical protein FXW25_04160 [Candidatus Liberibacter asiaticus]